MKQHCSLLYPDMQELPFSCPNLGHRCDEWRPFCALHKGRWESQGAPPCFALLQPQYLEEYQAGTTLVVQSNRELPHLTAQQSPATGSSTRSLSEEQAGPASPQRTTESLEQWNRMKRCYKVMCQEGFFTSLGLLQCFLSLYMWGKKNISLSPFTIITCQAVAAWAQPAGGTAGDGSQDKTDSTPGKNPELQPMGKHGRFLGCPCQASPSHSAVKGKEVNNINSDGRRKK